MTHNFCNCFLVWSLGLISGDFTQKTSPPCIGSIECIPLRRRNLHLRIFLFRCAQMCTPTFLWKPEYPDPVLEEKKSENFFAVYALRISGSNSRRFRTDYFNELRDGAWAADSCSCLPNRLVAHTGCYAHGHWFGRAACTCRVLHPSLARAISHHLEDAMCNDCGHEKDISGTLPFLMDRNKRMSSSQKHHFLFLWNCLHTPC